MLILSGGGDPELVTELDRYFVEHIEHDKTVLYIPIAMEEALFSYEECYDWFKRTYRPYGINNSEMCVDLKNVKLDHRYSAVFIGGGNTFKLLKKIKESGFNQLLIHYLQTGGVVYGGSAGAIIFGKTIHSADHADSNNVGLTDYGGLNLANGWDIWCHYKNEDDGFIKAYQNDLYILYEESGLIIKDGTVTSIGKEYLVKNEIG